MCWSHMLTQAELVDRITTTPPEQVPQLVQTHQLTVATLQELKEYSAQYYLTEPDRSRRIAQAAYQLSQHLPPPASALGSWTLGNALLHTSYLVEAKAHFAEARTQYLALGHDLEAARLSIGQIAALAYTGEPEAALQLALTIRPTLEAAARTDPADQLRLAGLLMNMGVLYDLRGQYEDSLSLYADLLEQAIVIDDTLLIGQVYHNRAYALVQLGAFDEAMTHYAQAEQRLAPLHVIADLVRLSINQGNLYTLLNRYEEAYTVLLQAEKYIDNLDGMEQARHRLAILRGFLQLQSTQSPSRTLLPALLAAQHAFAEHGPLYEATLAAILAGRLCLQVGDLVTAQANFTQAQIFLRQQPDHTLAYRLLHGQALLAQAQQEIAAALQFYAAAVAQLEAIRCELQIEIYRAAFLTDKVQLYQDWAALYLALQQPESAFMVIERAKARAVTEKLASRLTVEAATGAAEADVETQSLVHELNQTLQTLDALYTQAEEASRGSAVEALTPLVNTPHAAIQTLEETVQQLVQQVQRRRPLFSPLAINQTVTLAQLQESLHETIFLQYHLTGNQFAVFVVGQSTAPRHLHLASLTAVEAARTAFARAVERMLNFVLQFGVARAQRQLPHLLNDAQQQLQSLYELLLAPLQPYVPPGAPLLIAPDSTLYYIPFHALYNGQHYVIENHTVSYTPNATLLTFCQRPPSAGTEHLLLGYDPAHLPAILAEIESLHRLLPTAHRFVQETATTAAFFAHAEKSRLIHLAAHANFRTDNPLLSSITLADRRLTLAEIIRLPIDADLVVLSGCETGKGQLRGTDLVSLAGGFLGAGARALLVSLWRAEDMATAALMQNFYQALLAGQTRGNALRNAQLALLTQSAPATDQKGLFAHPAFWAPFTLIGNPL